MGYRGAPSWVYKQEAATVRSSYSNQTRAFKERIEELEEENRALKEKIKKCEIFKFRKIVLATLPMKLSINRINKIMKFKYHQLFMEFLKQIDDYILDFQWPIHTLHDKKNSIKTIDQFYEFFCKLIEELQDTQLKTDLKKRKKRAQLMLAARYMNLPRNKKIEK